jgi:cob(I)alamin adenosyltransferase
MSLKPQHRNSETSLTSSRKARLEFLKSESKLLQSQTDISAVDPSALLIQSEIYKLQDQSDTYSRKIQFEKSQVDILKSETERLNQDLEDLRKQALVSQSKLKANSDINNRKIKNLENKVDKSLQKLNETLAYNRNLREKINKIRKEKIIYSNMCKQLQEELDKKLEEMKNISELSSQAIKDRKESKKKLNELKLEAELMNDEFQSDWRNLESMIVKDIAAKDPLNEVPLDLESKEDFQFSEMETRATNGKELIESQNQKLKEYDDELAELIKNHGLKSLEEIVNVFVDSEMQNLSIFNHVMELSGEMEQLDLQIAEIRSKIEKHRVPDTEIDLERKDLIRNYQLRMEKLNLKEEDLNPETSRIRKTLTSLVEGIKILCEKIGLHYEEISEKNLLLVLSDVEKKLDEKVQEKKLKSIKANANENLKKLEIDAPLVVDKDEEDDIGLPMTMDEIRFKSLKKLNEENEKRYRRK